MQDLTASVAQAAPMYTDARQIHVTVPGLSVGDELEYHVVQTLFDPLTPGEFWNAWNFLDNAICLDESVELNIPKDRKVNYSSPPGVRPNSRIEEDRQIFRWETSHFRTPHAAGRFQTIVTGKKQMSFSTFASWEAVGEWWAKLEAPRREVTPGIRAKAQEITREAKTDEEKVEAIYEWVQRNIRYVSLSFGIGRYQPHAAGEVRRECLRRLQRQDHAD